MNPDLDVLGLLRKYENTDKLKKQAADEIERLRTVICDYYKAEEEYSQAWNDAYDDDTAVILKDEWQKAWQVLENEVMRNG